MVVFVPAAGAAGVGGTGLSLEESITARRAALSSSEIRLSGTSLMEPIRGALALEAAVLIAVEGAAVETVAAATGLSVKDGVMTAPVVGVDAALATFSTFSRSASSALRRAAAPLRLPHDELTILPKLRDSLRSTNAPKRSRASRAAVSAPLSRTSLTEALPMARPVFSTALAFSSTLWLKVRCEPLPTLTSLVRDSVPTSRPLLRAAVELRASNVLRESAVVVRHSVLPMPKRLFAAAFLSVALCAAA